MLPSLVWPWPRFYIHKYGLCHWLVTVQHCTILDLLFLFRWLLIAKNVVLSLDGISVKFVDYLMTMKEDSSIAMVVEFAGVLKIMSSSIQVTDIYYLNHCIFIHRC